MPDRGRPRCSVLVERDWLFPAELDLLADRYAAAIRLPIGDTLNTHAQLVRACVSPRPRRVNILVVGSRKSGKSTLASLLVEAAVRAGGRVDDMDCAPAVDAASTFSPQFPINRREQCSSRTKAVTVHLDNNTPVTVYDMPGFEGDHALDDMHAADIEAEVSRMGHVNAIFLCVRDPQVADAGGWALLESVPKWFSFTSGPHVLNAGVAGPGFMQIVFGQPTEELAFDVWKSDWIRLCEGANIPMDGSYIHSLWYWHCMPQYAQVGFADAISMATSLFQHAVNRGGVVFNESVELGSTAMRLLSENVTTEISLREWSVAEERTKAEFEILQQNVSRGNCVKFAKASEHVGEGIVVLTSNDSPMSRMKKVVSRSLLLGAKNHPLSVISTDQDIAAELKGLCCEMEVQSGKKDLLLGVIRKHIDAPGESKAVLYRTCIGKSVGTHAEGAARDSRRSYATTVRLKEDGAGKSSSSATASGGSSTNLSVGGGDGAESERLRGERSPKNERYLLVREFEQVSFQEAREIIALMGIRLTQNVMEAAVGKKTACSSSTDEYPTSLLMHLPSLLNVEPDGLELTGKSREASGELPNNDLSPSDDPCALDAGDVGNKRIDGGSSARRERKSSCLPARPSTNIAEGGEVIECLDGSAIRVPTRRRTKKDVCGQQELSDRAPVDDSSPVPQVGNTGGEEPAETESSVRSHSSGTSSFGDAVDKVFVRDTNIHCIGGVEVTESFPVKASFVEPAASCSATRIPDQDVKDALVQEVDLDKFTGDSLTSCTTADTYEGMMAPLGSPKGDELIVGSRLSLLSTSSVICNGLAQQVLTGELIGLTPTSPHSLHAPQLRYGMENSHQGATVSDLGAMRHPTVLFSRQVPADEAGRDEQNIRNDGRMPDSVVEAFALQAQAEVSAGSANSSGTVSEDNTGEFGE